MEQAESILVKMVLNAWESHDGRTNKLLTGFSDAQFMQAVAPGRNRGIYLLGHLTAVHDAIPELLGFDKPMYPELDAVFVQNPDHSESVFPDIHDLLKCWHLVSRRLNAHIHSMKQAQWFEPHTAISQEDFLKEPHRNKLNIIVNRTNHLSYHLGQLALLANKA